MTQAYLYLRYRGSAGTMAAFKEVNRQLVQIGSDFGTVSASSDDIIACNRIVHWENDLYAVGSSGVWKYDVSTSGPWALAHAFATPHATASNKDCIMGLTPCSIEGEPVLVTAYSDVTSLNHMKVVKIFPTGIVEGPARKDAFSVADFGVNNYFWSPISYRNSVMWGGFNKVCQYDLKTDTFQVIKPSTGNGTTYGLCIFRDKPFVMGQFSTTNRKLYRLEGNWPVLVDDIPLASGLEGLVAQDVVTGTHTTNMLIPHTSGIIAWALKSRGASADIYQNVFYYEFADGEVDNPTRTEVTADVLPVDFYDGTRSTNNQRPRWSIRQDPITNGADSPLYTIEYTDFNTQTEAATTNTVELYSWAPPNGPITFIDGGLNHSSFSRVHNPNSTGGINIWPGSGTLNVGQPQLVVNGEDIDVTFKLYGPPSTGVAIQLLYDKGDEYIETAGTLLSTSDGALLGSTAVTGLTVTGGNEVTVKWAATQDGIVREDNPGVCGRIYIP